MTFKDYLKTDFKQKCNEPLKEITYNNVKLNWNTNKTEEQFKQRIKDRTELSEDMFMETLQAGIDSTKLPKDKNICLYFMKSKFVIILNTIDNIIVTIRDGRWDRPSGFCNKIVITNEDAVKLTQTEIDYLNEATHFKMDVDKDFNIILESKCNYCFKVDL